MIWFVDLSVHPALPIKHRAVLSAAAEVSAMNAKQTPRNAYAVTPDDNGRRFWVKADSRGEALAIAQERAGR